MVINLSLLFYALQESRVHQEWMELLVSLELLRLKVIQVLRVKQETRETKEKGPKKEIEVMQDLLAHPD
jgi:hypothetical protein